MKKLCMVGVAAWLVAQAALAGELKLVWQVPGCFYPVLGWRMPVDLPASDWRIDQTVVGLNPTSYNCHFYTRLYLIQATQPEQVGRWVRHPRHDGVNTQILGSAGLRPLEPGEAAHVGDVMLAGRVDARGDITYTHSAVVRDVDEAGHILRIRQKFDDEHPVVDVDAVEFRMLYAGMYPYRTEVWTWAAGPLSQVALR